MMKWNHVKHLPHTIMSKIHSFVSSWTEMASNPSVTKAIITGDKESFMMDILQEPTSVFNTIQDQLRALPRESNLGFFSQPPTSWRDPSPKEPAQKKQRISKDREQGRTPSPDPEAKKGWITLKPGSYFPRTPRGVNFQWCRNFAIVGKKCNFGQNCRNKHVWPRHFTGTNEKIMQKWVDATQSISLAPGFSFPVPTDENETPDDHQSSSGEQEATSEVQE